MATNDRRPYLTALDLNQGLLDEAQDNLENKIEMIADIETPAGLIRVSDRNKYVGTAFYEALTQFPLIKRTVGEWLSPELEFSRLQMVVSNVDGRFNHLIPGGASFDGWIGRRVEVKIGLRDLASTYQTIYRGTVTEIGGFQRDRAKLTLTTRDDLDKADVNFPGTAFTKEGFPDIEDSYVGQMIPVIYGDWTEALVDDAAAVPAYPTNGARPGVLDGTESIELRVACHPLKTFDAAHVYLRRQDKYYPFPAGDITAAGDNASFTIKQPSGLVVEDEVFVYQPGDVILVRVVGWDLGSHTKNLVAQARDILTRYGQVPAGAFDPNWDTYRDKAAPAQSALATIRSRAWVQEPQSALAYALSMLEQVRLECFVDRFQRFKLAALHFEDMDPAPAFTVRNWDLVAESFAPRLDDRNIWNRARADYAYEPMTKENSRQTPLFRNNAAIAQAGKEISRKVVFPNLYVEGDVIQQLKEMLKLASGYAEFIDMTLTSRAALRDVGEFIRIDVRMGSTIFEGVPAMIREIGYDPKGLQIPVKVWSFQMIPFPGYDPGLAGIVGGATATITQE